MEGRVKWFNRKKGFGFIVGNDGKDAFVHYSDILDKGYKSLYDGDFVSYDTKESPKGLVAINVKKELPKI